MWMRGLSARCLQKGVLTVFAHMQVVLMADGFLWEGNLYMSSVSTTMPQYRVMTCWRRCSRVTLAGGDFFCSTQAMGSCKNLWNMLKGGMTNWRHTRNTLSPRYSYLSVVLCCDSIEVESYPVSLTSQSCAKKMACLVALSAPNVFSFEFASVSTCQHFPANWNQSCFCFGISSHWRAVDTNAMNQDRATACWDFIPYPLFASGASRTGRCCRPHMRMLGPFWTRHDQCFSSLFYPQESLWGRGRPRTWAPLCVVRHSGATFVCNSKAWLRAWGCCGWALFEAQVAPWTEKVVRNWLTRLTCASEMSERDLADATEAPRELSLREQLQVDSLRGHNATGVHWLSGSKCHTDLLGCFKSFWDDWAICRYLQIATGLWSHCIPLCESRCQILANRLYWVALHTAPKASPKAGDKLQNLENPRKPQLGSFSPCQSGNRITECVRMHYALIWSFDH